MIQSRNAGITHTSILSIALSNVDDDGHSEDGCD